jgi:hypothetical protein
MHRNAKDTMGGTTLGCCIHHTVATTVYSCVNSYSVLCIAAISMLKILQSWCDSGCLLCYFYLSTLIESTEVVATVSPNMVEVKLSALQ